MRSAVSGALLLAALVAVATPGCGGSAASAPAVTAPSGSSAPEPDAPTARAVLKWTARSERGVYGYLIYRAASEEGPFLRINREILHVDPERPTGPSEYEYVDGDVVAGRTFYYYLATVGDDGKKRRFSGVIAKQIPGP